MAKKKTKKKKKNKPKVIEYSSCPYCGGTGQSIRIVDNPNVEDAIAEITNTAKKIGCNIGGGIDFEICIGGETQDLRKWAEGLTKEQKKSPAKDVKMSYFEYTDSDSYEWQNDRNLLNLLQNRLEWSRKPDLLGLAK